MSPRAMNLSRSSGIAVLLVTAGLGLAGCGGSAQGATDDAAAQMATVNEPGDGGPAVVTLAGAAVKRLDIQTTPVAGSAGRLTVPYSAVVYEPDGSSWVYTQTEERTYQRAAITVAGVHGDEVTLAQGPAVGTQVVSQGAAELVGVETGIDGEE
jgi:hypothetical protein